MNAQRPDPEAEMDRWKPRRVCDPQEEEILVAEDGAFVLYLDHLRIVDGWHEVLEVAIETLTREREEARDALRTVFHSTNDPRILEIVRPFLTPTGEKAAA